MTMLLGMDEVGRGSWAGPVVVGAVILARPISGLRDSKQLSVKSREKLALLIKEKAAAWSLGQAEVQEIDRLGLTTALTLAYQRALQQIATSYQEIIIDGSFNFLPEVANVSTVVKADGSVPSVSAASIIAKVARDNLMTELAAKHPQYGFERHVGYGTAAHAAALAKFGACDLHRRSFAPVRRQLEGQA